MRILVYRNSINVYQKNEERISFKNWFNREVGFPFPRATPPCDTTAAGSRTTRKWTKDYEILVHFLEMLFGLKSQTTKTGTRKLENGQLKAGK